VRSERRTGGGLQVAFLGGAEVSYREEPPPPALAPWVATIWHLRAHRPFALRILPDACIDLIGGDVIGPFAGAHVVQLDAGDRATGIRLRPGAFPALFGYAARELIDLRLPLTDVLGTRRSLLHAAKDAEPPDPLAEAALAARSVRELASETGYSVRNLRRRLVAATGHGPKRLARIGRMHALLRAGRGESWARTAVEHGFYDEAHMANDIRELAGATPHALLGRHDPT
jgi:AraC-like DNA-binding protein